MSKHYFESPIMLRRHTLLGFIAATTLIAANAQTTLTSAPKTLKLLIQMSDAEPARWNLALNNAKNTQDELGAGNIEIEIVAYGPGIGMLKLDSLVNSRLADAAKAGVKIVACENTMRNQKISRDDMHPSVSFVASGVVELVRKQSEGWAYVRP